MKIRGVKHKVAAVIFACAVFSVMESAAVYCQEARSLMDKQCIRCHNLERVHHNQMSAARWDATVKRMHSKDPVWLTEPDIAAIVDYLAVNNLIDGKQLFEKKCFDCHNQYYNKKSLFLKKTRQGWERAIERMRKRFYMFIGIDEAEEIAVYWTDPKNNENIKLEPDNYDRLEGVFENKCGACHSHKFLYKYKYDLKQWQAVLGRMYQKNPIILKESDLRYIKDYLLQSESLLIK